jgi:SAM-dependent methyltransferase
MGRNRRNANQKYHDRVAPRYEEIYDDDYWQWHDALTWEHLKRFLPADLRAPVIDLGCGSGKWGRKLLKSGYHVTFSDLSIKMVDQAQKEVDSAGGEDRADFIQASLMDLASLPQGHFGLATAMGEPIGLAESPLQALRQIFGVLRPGGVLVGTIDNRIACIDYYLTQDDPDALEAFLKTGRTQWLTRDPAERFPIQTFDPQGLRKLLEHAGFEVLDVIGKTVLPMRRHRELLEDSQARRRWLKIEKNLAGDPANFARCAHLQFAARRIAPLSE